MTTLLDRIRRDQYGPEHDDAHAKGWNAALRHVEALILTESKLAMPWGVINVSGTTHRRLKAHSERTGRSIYSIVGDIINRELDAEERSKNAVKQAEAAGV
jgi:hypothetical protein